jgi:hypothetical protein
MEVAEIKPILKPDKATLIFSAQRERYFRVTWTGYDIVTSVLRRQRPKPASLLPLPH